MFEVTLFLHSWFRWIVLIVAVMLLVRFTKSWIKKDSWFAGERSYITGFKQIYYTQVAIGLLLYIGLSPIPKAVLGNNDLLRNTYFFFFSIRHPLSMLLALGAFQMGTAIAFKKPKESRYKILSLTMIGMFLIILSAVPWPGHAYGRVLFRAFE